VPQQWSREERQLVLPLFLMSVHKQKKCKLFIFLQIFFVGLFAVQLLVQYQLEYEGLLHPLNMLK
jgi:hypothetical protein